MGGRGFHEFILEQEVCLQSKTPESGRELPCSLYPAGSGEAWVWVRLLCGPRGVLLCLLIAALPLEAGGNICLVYTVFLGHSTGSLTNICRTDERVRQEREREILPRQRCLTGQMQLGQTEPVKTGGPRLQGLLSGSRSPLSSGTPTLHTGMSQSCWPTEPEKAILFPEPGLSAPTVGCLSSPGHNLPLCPFSKQAAS